jgi:excisionase family DNA binding protein
MNQQVLSLQAVAERLDISDETVRREIEGGKLRAYRIGRQWRVFEADLQDYLARQSSQCAA